MVSEAIELFYSYAHEDEALRNRLNNHLSLLRQQGFIRAWYDRDINAGSLWAQEIDAHLASARIILLLVSPSFLASDYCYGIEMKEAMRRHEAGEATVIPIILRPCDWEDASFAKLHALPKDAKAVTMWANRDAAFTDIAKGIRKLVNQLNGNSPATSSEDTTLRTKGTQKERSAGEKPMQSAPTINTPALKRAVDRYYKELEGYRGKADYELALRSAFQNLLADTAHQVKWTLIPEQTLDSGVRPDGVLRDTFDLKRGFWEAKGPKSDLDKEIAKKIASGYPLTNTIFENTQRAVLYQNKKRMPTEFDLQNRNDVSDLLKQFFTYTEPDIENFETAVQEFKERIPELAKALLAILEREYKVNRRFISAFDTFAELCRTSLDPKITPDVINEMLIQHLLTERLFRTIFDNPDFVRRNVIASEIEKVIEALASRSFNRNDFLKSLDRFYVAIEGAARGIDSWSERQHFLNTVYERFFQGYSVKRADTYGIVYTPQEIVDFMCASVEEVLQREFGKSIAEPDVQILDPATGTGSFIVNLLHRIPRHKLKYKYQHDLFCNEIMLLPYYIASLNIEHEYYAKMGEYEPFEGVCFTDTLELAEGRQLPLFVEENTERVKREKDAQIMVVIGNPPYNVGQVSENDNNKNRKYSVIDQGIHDTYAKDSKATLNTKLYDAYVKFFRWAVDRLQGRDGIVCFISNNSFIDQTAFDGMRKHLQKDFTQIYHLDLHGNVRKNPKLSGTTHNVFGIQVGVGITIAIRSSAHATQRLYYYRVPENWRKTEKLVFLRESHCITGIQWSELYSDERHSWIITGMRPEFTTFLQMSAKNAKNAKTLDTTTIFKNYSLGISTNRDGVVYDFNYQTLIKRVEQFIDNYNTEVFRWIRGGHSKDIDSFLSYEKIKWSRNLKRDLRNGRFAQFDKDTIRQSLYRPFSTKWLYYADILVDERGQASIFFPNVASEGENAVIVVGGYGRKEFAILASKLIPNLNFYADPAQCFPFYTYNEDGTNRRENITDWALTQFQTKYGPLVTKWDIFHYVYAMLHHPQYRERYAENLKRDLPHIPLLHTREAFESCVQIGKQLMNMHINYEQAKEYSKLEWFENEGVPFSWRVEKMRLSNDKRVVVVNDSLRLGPIPPECFEYRLGNRSALDWVI
ncbi:MAG: TIR domain-containing protein, partial [Ktedonobacteraceae bacterium]|nr:TIR domain-containing protein [Ktedonobacteraceae bacterium]